MNVCSSSFKCRSVCNSVVVEVGAGSLVAYRSSERGLLRLNRVLVLRTKLTNDTMVAKVFDSYCFVAPDSCAGVSLAVPMAFRAKAVVAAKVFRAKNVR